LGDVHDGNDDAYDTYDGDKHVGDSNKVEMGAMDENMEDNSPNNKGSNREYNPHEIQIVHLDNLLLPLLPQVQYNSQFHRCRHHQLIEDLLYLLLELHRYLQHLEIDPFQLPLE
jgi:hypothetical protein